MDGRKEELGGKSKEERMKGIKGRKVGEGRMEGEGRKERRNEGRKETVSEPQHPMQREFCLVVKRVVYKLPVMAS
jgi:hypothetical protein